jgi:hypothetical protein
MTDSARVKRRKQKEVKFGFVMHSDAQLPHEAMRTQEQSDLPNASIRTLYKHCASPMLHCVTSIPNTIGPADAAIGRETDESRARISSVTKGVFDPHTVN